MVFVLGLKKPIEYFYQLLAVGIFQLSSGFHLKRANIKSSEKCENKQSRKLEEIQG